jgi:hypothetical protein
MFTILCNISVRAQSSPDGAGPEELIQRLQKRIDQLEASQKVMQEKIDHMGAAAPWGATAGSGSNSSSRNRRDAAGGTASMSWARYNFTASATSTMAGAWFDKLPPGGLKGSTNSFNVWDFDLYTNTQLSDSWSMLGEMLVSSDFSNEFSVEMDRLLLPTRRNDSERPATLNPCAGWGPSLPLSLLAGRANISPGASARLPGILRGELREGRPVQRLAAVGQQREEPVVDERSASGSI